MAEAFAVQSASLFKILPHRELTVGRSTGRATVTVSGIGTVDLLSTFRSGPAPLSTELPLEWGRYGLLAQ
jgi:hypothetical protein